MNQNTNMEMNMDTGAAKKQGKGMMFGMIACAILAVGGIGFGIYEMSQVKTAKQQIADLKIEVKKDDGSTTTIETDKIEVKEADKTVVITDSAKTREDGYFYFDEWGIKVKLADGENYKVLGYLYDGENKAPDDIQGEYKIWGGSYSAENSDVFVGYYPSVSDSPSLCVVRFITELIPHYAQYYGEYHKVWADEKYTYYAVNPNGMTVADDTLQLKIADFWKNSGFMDSANYSAI